MLNTHVYGRKSLNTRHTCGNVLQFQDGFSYGLFGSQCSKPSPNQQLLRNSHPCGFAVTVSVSKTLQCHPFSSLSTVATIKISGSPIDCLFFSPYKIATDSLLKNNSSWLTEEVYIQALQALRDMSSRRLFTKK